MLTYTQRVNGQLRTDTICPTVDNYKALVIKAEQGKVASERVTILTERLSGKDSVIKEMRNRDSVTLIGHRKELASKDDQNKAALDAVAALNKKLKWERTKRDVFGWTALVGIVYGIFKSLK